jgi:cytochrome c-type biogenesis protein
MSFASVASNGPLLLAVGASAIAGLVSFLSPCVLPLVPGYVSYVTGLAGADLDAALGTDPHGNPVAPPRGGDVVPPHDRADPPGTTAVLTRTVPVARTAARVRGRILAGSLLFIAGFTAVFTLTNVVAAGVGRTLLRHERAVEIGVGVAVIVLGLAYLGLIPGLQREVRIRRLPAAGLAGAPVLGAVFALSWVPCLGPTLVAVLGLSLTGGQTGRAVVLAAAYCLGLGLPFLAFGLGFRRLLGVFAVIRRNSRWVTRVGGALLLVIGLALVTGGWTDFLDWLRATVGAGKVGI